MAQEEKQQVKSKQRVVDRGEVFTAEREVNAMLDLVKQETERIDSRFLEPACGDGNFLAEILRRKLDVVERNYKRSQADYEKYAVLALMSMYGVDIMQDNIEECRERLFAIWNERYNKLYKSTRKKVQAVAKYILSKNIICGNALSMMEVDGNGKDIEGHYVIFSEWSFVMGNSVKRRDFRLDQLLDGSNGVNRNFGTDFEYDKETNTFIPLPIKEYPITDYLNLPNVEDYVPEEEEEPEQLSFF